jgi:hypothetical protein
MLKKGLFTILIVITLLGFAASSVRAQTYLFTLNAEVVNVYLNQDGTAALDYILDFKNDPSASPIDYVDLGLPNGSYDLNSVTADVNGSPVASIDQADPNNLNGGKYGVTLSLGGNAIQPGTAGRVHISIPSISKIFYNGTDQNHPNYASFQFSPNWFGSSYVNGSTNLTVDIHLPPGVKPEEGVYYPASNNWPGEKAPTPSLDNQGRVLYHWQAAQASGSTQYTFGASFPASIIPAAAIVKPSLLPEIDPSTLICLCVGGFFVFFFAATMIGGIRAGQKRKLKYLPPKISIEGHGIKRGLTAVEAGILMEQPMDKILTMVLFSVVKKNAATVKVREPLQLDVVDPLPDGLYDYERDFLTAFKTGTPASQRTALQDMMIGLVKSVSEKMKGFSRKETITYYQSIMEQAWAQVAAANTPEVKAQKYDEVMDWTMLDHNYGTRTLSAFGGGPVFVPVWWPRYDPVYRSQMGPSLGSAGGAAGGPGRGSVSLPNLPGSDFAASVVNGVQSMSAGILGDVAAFTGGVTNKTNPVPVSPPSTYHGGGGGGCACACACAGCACACAGGGR